LEDSEEEGPVECPVCGMRVDGIGDIGAHVSACLDTLSSENQWQPAHEVLDRNVSIAANELPDVYVDIEGDTPAIYGPQQYTEADLHYTNLPRPSEVAETRCSVCLGGYSTPVISVQCFHVFCEGCWLKSLGGGKVCPGCRVITLPGDLRRIYL
jgi:Zinc finger, C3HC4 type (RING finger)